MNWLESKSFESYWIGTAGVESFSRQISDRADNVLQEALEISISNVPKSIDHFSTVINYVPTVMSEGSLWNFLILTGYLTYTPSINDKTRGLASIPNHELRKHWRTVIKSLLEEKIIPMKLSELLSTLRNFDVQKFASVLQNLVTKSSFYDHTPENSYHMLGFGALGFAAEDFNDVVVTSNRESGHGRFDISVDFKDVKKVVIIEFKKSKSLADLDVDALAGLQQIIDQNYIANYSEYDCLLIGISFFKKHMSELKCQGLSTRPRSLTSIIL
jgi:hypothetical protein